MTKVLGYWNWGVMALLCVVVAPEARAEAQDPSVGLTFDAPSECDDRAAFIARVRSYTSKAHFTDDVSVRLFAVSIAQAPESLIGNLEIVSESERATRTVTGKTCPELLDALALMTALAIDPNALTSLPPATTPEPRPEKKKPEPRLAKPRIVLPRTKEVSDGGAQWSVGALGLGALRVLPKVALGGAILGDVRTSTTASVRASFALGLHYLTHSDQTERTLTVSYAALGVQAQGCAELGATSNWRPAICLGGILGRLRSRTENLPEVSSSGTRNWFGVVLGPRLDFELSDFLALRIETSAGWHLLEHQILVLAIEPNGTTSQTQIHHIEGPFATAGLGLLFHL